MLMKSIAAGLAGTALLATAAFAQTPTTTERAPAAATTTTTTTTPVAQTSATGEWRTSKMDGINVYNDANEKIGSISDLLMDKSGNVKLAVIGVGGFLGMGEHMVAIPFEKLKFVNQPVASTNTANNAATTNTANRPASTTTTTGAATTNTIASTTSKWYPDHAVFNASKDELKNMPEFKYSE